MLFPPRVGDYANRALSPAKASRLIAAASNLDEAVFGGQDLERITTSMVVMAEQGVPTDTVIELALTDWRDLLMAGGLGTGDWPIRLAALLASEAQP